MLSPTRLNDLYLFYTTLKITSINQHLKQPCLYKADEQCRFAIKISKKKLELVLIRMCDPSLLPIIYLAKKSISSISIINSNTRVVPTYLAVNQIFQVQPALLNRGVMFVNTITSVRVCLCAIETFDYQNILIRLRFH